ncbi:MAG: FkbM family methyltransferase [Nitrospira sp.]|nr:FkbM family methyltransferase [Nitrospira sp.]MDH4302471.1 FkbM family methyltransferase [Nitrospira sp.]MDH5192243.1 FkbM family methyltransferase [Nitrospira sp.]
MIRKLVHQLKRGFTRSDAKASSVALQPDTTEEQLREKTVNFYRQFLNTGDLCFDVGANVGNKTHMFLELGARVVCIEPQPNCVAVLKAKYQRDTNVVVVCKGLATQQGRKMLSICGTADTISTFSDKWKTGRFRPYAWDQTVEVPVTTLDILLQEFGMPKFCKIDVEGFEYEVLKGLSAPIPFMAFEFTREFLDDARLCMEYLESLGSADFNYALSESPALIFPNWVSGYTALKSIEQNANDLLWGDIYVRFQS